MKDAEDLIEIIQYIKLGSPVAAKNILNKFKNKALTHLETAMNTRTGTNESEKFINRPWWFMFRGAMMFVCGSLVAIFSVTAPKCADIRNKFFLASCSFIFSSTGWNFALC